MKTLIIKTKKGKLRFRKSTLGFIEKERKELSIKGTLIFKRYWGLQEQKEIILKWSAYITEKTAFNYAPFHKEIPVIPIDNMLFGTILFRRKNEIMKQYKYFKKQKLELSRLKKQYENTLHLIFVKIIKEAVYNNYSDELLLNCLFLLDNVIETLNTETSVILVYTDKILKCNKKFMELKRLEEKGQFQEFVSNSEYLKVREMFDRG